MQKKYINLNTHVHKLKKIQIFLKVNLKSKALRSLKSVCICNASLDGYILSKQNLFYFFIKLAQC